MIKANATGYFPYTPALPMLYGLRESLKILFEEKLERVFERHNVLASGVRAAVKAWGLQPCAKEPKWYSDTVTAIVVPPGFNGADVIDAAFRRYNLSLGAGLSQVAGKLFRIGHLGDLNDLMVLGALSGAEMAMRDVGIDIELGSGVAAAQTLFPLDHHGQGKEADGARTFRRATPGGRSQRLRRRVSRCRASSRDRGAAAAARPWAALPFGGGLPRLCRGGVEPER